jgi:Antibiotic biosynthesis monooxygenase
LSGVTVSVRVMGMAIELARFTVRDGAEQQLLEGRPTMVAALKRRFPGCVAAYLTREDDGGWLDVVLWRSREEAERAAALVNSVPECASWFGHIAESRGLRHVEVVDMA